jgi:galacturan 1,4-alpha-galacturonidase
MKITGLSNVEIDIRGTLLWSTDMSYWLSHSLPMGYQSQSTAFILGGDRVHMYSSTGVGTFDGNGQVWYEAYGSVSNKARRPHQITFNGLTNSVIEGIKFVQSQMWTMTLIHSSKVLLQDIYVNNTNFENNAYGNNLNTDGANTIYASDITFTRWVVDNGDDNIAFKASELLWGQRTIENSRWLPILTDSTNILVEDCTFYRSTGVAFGSIGQFENQFEVLEDITVRRIAAHNNKYGAYVKTWTGVVQGTPPNGGGAGLGYLRNVTISEFMVENALQAFYLTQCNSYSGFTGQCDTSKFAISDLSIRTMGGSLQTDVVASMQCSGVAPCTGISIRDVFFNVNGGGTAKQYLCSNVVRPDGFQCTGKAPQT